MTVAPFAVSIVPELDAATVKLMSDLDYVRSGWWKELARLHAYRHGMQAMGYLDKAVREQFGEDVRSLVLNFPELVVDAHNDRLEVEGFRFPGESAGDRTLWSVWQANNMDEQSVMGHDEALGLSRAAAIVGRNPDSSGEPIVTVESPFDVSWIRNPATGQAMKGQKCWTEADNSEWRTLYEIGRTRVLTKDVGGWRVVQDDQHGFSRLPLVPLINRPMIKARDGRSEFESVVDLADAANKIATDMMISAEYHAMPRRWAFGLKQADFKNADGSRKSAWSFVKGRLWVNEDKDVKVGQFPESDLANFHNTIKLLARLVGQMTAMPIDYLAFDSVNPPSADALRAAESRLVKRVERRQTSFGGAWEEVMRVALLFKGGMPPEAMQLETVWRDAATPTIAQKYDAIVKAVTTRGADGRPLVPTEQGRIDLGYTPAQREDMLKMERDAAEMAAESDPLTQSAIRLADQSANRTAAPDATASDV